MATDSERSEDDLEEITLSQASKEFGIKHSTLKVWVWSGKIPARKEFSDLGQTYYMVRRGEISRFLHSRSNRGRPLKRGY